MGLWTPSGPVSGPLGLPLVDPAGSPLPPSRLLSRLREIDSRLDVIWHPVLKKWSVIERWHPQDRRWKLHREGVIATPWDVVCFCPPDQDPDTVGDYIVEQVHRVDLEKNPSRRKLVNRIREMQEHNRRLREKAAREAVEPVVDELRYQARRILRDPGRIGRAEGVEVRYRS